MICAACSAVRVSSVVRMPPRASTTATAVPNDPAPTTVARRARGAGRRGSCRSGMRTVSLDGQHPVGASVPARVAGDAQVTRAARLVQLERQLFAGSLEVGELRCLDHMLEVEDAAVEQV